MRLFILCFSIIHSVYLIGQEEYWSLSREVEIKNIEAWDVDPMGKVIYAKNEVLTKLDSSFSVQFTQSLKSFGAIKKIDSRHSLKTLIFSEEQQAIAFIDNTLTFHKNLKDLSIINVAYATHVSYSAQTNRYWVFDGDNSKLVLIDENRRRPQVIENLAGTLGTLDLSQLIEIENVLLLFDKSKGIYLFDIYGSLIDFIATHNGISIHFRDEHLFYVTSNELIRVNIRNREEVRIPLPEEVESFRVLGRYIFFQTPTHLKKYLLKRTR